MLVFHALLISTYFSPSSETSWHWVVKSGSISSQKPERVHMIGW